MSGPRVVCVVGRKKSGKTTTVVGLVSELAARGVRVMTAKHGHRFDLDREGSDSWKHRHVAGAERVLMAGPDGFALLGGWCGATEGSGGAPHELPLEELVARHLADAEIVVAEGFKASSFRRIEVHRRAAGHPAPLYGTPEGPPGLYLALLTDDPACEAGCPTRHVDDPGRFSWLADLVMADGGDRLP